MKSFEAFYQAVRPSLDELERERQALTKRLLFLIRLSRWGLIPFIIINYIGVSAGPMQSRALVMVHLMALVASVVAFLYFNFIYLKQTLKLFSSRYKQVFLEPLILSIFQNRAQYLPDKTMFPTLPHILGLGEVQRMNLSNRPPDHQVLHEGLVGIWGSAQFTLSRQQLFLLVETHRGHYNRQFFQGLLLSAEWPAAFGSEIYIIQQPPPYRQFSAFTHNLAHTIQPPFPLVQTQDPLLEKHYWIYAKDDLAKAWLKQGPLFDFLHQWLKTSNTQRLKLNIQDRRLNAMVEKAPAPDTPLSILVGNWFTKPQLPHNEQDYFQPDLNKPLNEEAQVRQWYEEFALLCDLMTIVEALQKQA